MKTLIQKLIILLICVAKTWSDCDVCQSNIVACHRENQYSLCIKGVPTNNFVTCPENHVCTSGPFVCYPLPKAKPSCVRKTNLCGVCNHNKVYACKNETTIAFCYGQKNPLEGEDVSYCLGNTVCDIYSENGFCSERHLAKPSCITTSDVTAPEATIATTTSQVISTTTSKKPFLTTSYATTTAERTRKTTTAKPRTSTTAAEKTNINASVITEQTTTNAKIEQDFIIPTTKAATTKKPITSSTELTNKTTIIQINTSTTTTTTPRPTTATIVTQRTTSVSVTPSIPNNPAQICKRAGTTGSFYAGDPTCTTFVLCYMMNGSIIGLQKECPSTQYFAPGAKSCSSEKTAICV